ncbi:glutamine-hydrolyzing GMP synthase [Candidatus Peregrinibacteria bacterium]|nr:glutamine-hydrolyzing GMP synthase [Candidatus Peregrinibacteria bacterium]
MKKYIRKGSVVILDFGGQYAHLIGRRVRECGAFSEILPPETPAILLKGAAGIILSGGPQSVYDRGAPQGDRKIFELGIPVLGICYGLQWMAKILGGEVKAGKTKEYGRTQIKNLECKMQNVPEEFTVWMSHGDEVVKVPEGFVQAATSDACANAAIADEKRKFYGVQFHPEVTHTEYGTQILKNFVGLCDAAPWSVQSFHQEIREQVRKDAGTYNVFMLVSGGVDSTVAFALLNEVLGQDHVQGLLIDIGLMRKGEIREVQDAFKKVGMTNLHVEDASDEFFSALKDIYDPEEKRKIIGKAFLNVQHRVCVKKLARKTKNWLLGQGTIYPDTIETGGTAHADHIKTHHNRIPEIQSMIDRGEVIEPLKDLYKDEVRRLGEELGLPHELVWRHPFPGPGLAVRILCVPEDSHVMVRKRGLGMTKHVILPIKSVGVQGDSRTYKHAIVLFSDSKLPAEEHWNLATEIPNKYPNINRVLFCLSHTEPLEFVLTPGYVTRERADLLRTADNIIDEEMRAADLYEKIWQFPVVLLPVGIKTGGESIVLRPVESTEAMTANAARLPEAMLHHIAEELLALPGIDAVFYDLTSKPPATIEWE